MMPVSDGDILRTTGGQIDNIVLALIEASYDKNDHVASSMCKSLFYIGKHQPNLVLTSCYTYLKCHLKMPLAHKILVLTVMEQICNDALKSIKNGVAFELIKLAVEEMVAAKEIVPEWQNVASGILVSLGRSFHNEVMEHLLAKFQPGVLPHFFVLQTMANLASANVYGMVPFLKVVLGTLLPLLCSIKQENMKWIFAYALSKFSEAIVEYIATIEKAPDPTVSKAVFQGEICSAYDILFNNWLQSRESKVRSEVVVALGHMTHVISSQKVDELLPKVLPAVLSMYRKHQEYQYTTQGLCMILDAAVTNKSSVLDVHLDNILSVLFPQVCTFPDYTVPASVRNHNEVLRCFAVLAQAYIERIITYLLQKLDSNNEAHKIGSLTVIKHLINSSSEFLKDQVSNILLGLKSVLDCSNKVKKVIAQVIVALAHHGYLETTGGRDMVWFVVSQCALPEDQHVKRPNDPNYVSNEALKGMCENVIQLLTTTVENMSNTLWQCLFDCLLSEPLTAAVGPVCKSLAFLAHKKKADPDSNIVIDYNNFVNVNSPQMLFARLVVLTGFPHKGGNRGLYVLQLMKAIAPGISKSLQALWDEKIPPLIRCLESCDVSDWDQADWEDQITEFFTMTLSEHDREEWTSVLGNVLLTHFSLYVNSSSDKYILLKFLGIIMKKVTNKTFINNCLDVIFNNVNHHNDIERLGCAVAVGYCGATHLDLVLVKLEQTAKDEKKSSIFSFIMDFKGDVDHEKLKATIILCYGHVTANGPAAILSTRIETPILRSVLGFYAPSKDPLVREAMLETVKLIAEAVYSNKINDAVSFRSRNELLNLMKTILKGESGSPITSPCRHLALNACASLVALDPALKDDEKCSLIEVAVSSVYSLPKELQARKTKEDIVDLSPDLDQFLFASVDALNGLLENLLLKERNQLNLQTMFQILCVWINSKFDIERERCMNSANHLIRSYAKATENEGFSPFTSLGFILAILVPRCTDSQATVRHLAFDSIEVVLQISLRLRAPISPASPVSPSEDSISFSLKMMRVDCDDPAGLFTVTKALGKLISDKLPVEQVTFFLRTLVSGLCDPHSQSSSGASVVFNRVVKLRGRELRQDALLILEAMRMQLPNINCPHTRKGALLGIQNIAIYHSLTVFTSLLNTSLPLDVDTIDVWKTLVKEENLANLFLDHCLEVLSEGVVFVPPDPHGRSHSPIASFKSLAIICALKEIFKVADVMKCCKEKFDPIFSSLLLVIGQYMCAVPPTLDETRGSGIVISWKAEGKALSISPLKCAIDALKNFLLCAQEDKIVSYLVENGDWLVFEDEDKYSDSVSTLGSQLCAHCPDYIPRIISFLNPMLNNSIDSHRIVSVALFVEFLRQDYKGQNVLVEPLINNLLGRLTDPSRVVRRLCISGLGSMGQLFHDQGQRYSSVLLSAMMAGMDDKDDPGCEIILEAMNGMSNALPVVAKEDVHKILINLAVRLRQMFEKEQPAVRGAAIMLFGNLSQFGSNTLQEEFVEQVHVNMITFLLHLNDSDKHVIKASKNTLRQVGPLLSSSTVNDMFQKHLLDDAHLHYGEFINGLTKLLIQEFADKLSSYSSACISYLKSPYSVIQCNSAIFLGHLLGNMPESKRECLPKEKICLALTNLLKDQTADVRIKAAESLSLLYEY